MSASYDRRINLFINGQAITNDVKSIRAEMMKLVNEQARMTLGSKQYLAHAAQIRTLNGILAQHRQEIAGVAKGWSMASLGDTFNRYQTMGMAFTASLAAAVLGFKALVKSFNDYEERVDNLSALTGLAGEDLDWLSKKAKELSTATLEGGIVVKQSAQDIVDAFTKVGSARPELLKDKEALSQVAQESIILSNAAKTELQPAIEALTMVMNQYNVPATEARRIINVLGAASKAGAGEIPYLTMAFEKAGTVSADAGLSIETLAAVIETLAPRISQPEIAGRSFKAVLLRLQQGADDTNPAIVGLTTAFENLGKKNLDVSALTKMFGIENITVGKILINNVGELKNYEKAVTGTNVAMEQAQINTSNNNAKLAQAGNRIALVSMELGEKLSPAMTLVTGYFGKMLRIISILVDFFIKYHVEIASATYGLIAYTLAVKLQTMWQARANQESLLTIVISKAKKLAMSVEILVMSLYSAATALMSGNITKAAQSMRVFFAVIKTSPLGFLVGVIVAVATALYFYTKKLTDVEIAQKALIDLNNQAKDSIVDEKTAMEQLLRIAQNETLSKEARAEAIKKLNLLSPEYLGGLTLETINTDKAKIATDKYIGSLLRAAELKAATDNLTESNKKIQQLQAGVGGEAGFFQTIGKTLTSKTADGYSSAKKEATAQNQADEIKAEEIRKTVYQTKIDSIVNTNSGLLTSKPKLVEDPISTTETSAEKKIRIATEKKAKKEASDAKREDKDQLTASLAALDASNDQKIAIINKDHLVNKTSDDQFYADLLAQELDYLSAKAALYPIGSKQYEEAMMKSYEKQVQAQEKVHKLLLSAQKELELAKIDNIQDAIDKQLALEEQRWNDELLLLQERLIIKKDLSDQEIAINDAVNQAIQEKTKTHEKTQSELFQAAALKKEMDNAIIREATSKTDEENWAAQQEIAQLNYEQQVIDAQGNAAKIAQAENALSAKIVNIKIQELNKREEIGNAVFSSANQLFGSLSTLAGRETALGKALFLFQQAAAIGQIIFNTAIANSKAVATSPLTFGMPWVAINTASAAVGIVSVIAQTISEFSGNKSKGHSEGGFTGPGGKYQYAGSVHKGEYVIPQEGVNNPSLAPLFNIVESARRNNSLSRLDLRSFARTSLNKSAFSSGGYTGSPTVSSLSSPIVLSDPAQAAVLHALSVELRLIRTNGIRANINKYGTNGLMEAQDDIAKFKSKVNKK
jgi:TP901 family phage tail tape measure protein